MSGETANVDAGRDSFWRRLTYTPLRDVVRGRMTGRLDVDAAMDHCRLPEALRDLIRRVIRKTRLTRIEKAEVARELAGHFEDGLASGATATALADAFGDVTTAAKLIGRARRRGRPAAVKMIRWTAQGVGAVFGLLLFVYVWFAVKLLVSEPNITRDYVAEFNAKIAEIPESDRAWPIYREAFLGIRDVQRRMSQCRSERPESDAWAECGALLEAHAEQIALYHEGAAKSHLGVFLNDTADRQLDNPGASPNAETNPTLFGLILSHPNILRVGARLLHVDARHAMASGDGDRALSDVRAVLQMVEHASESGFVIDQLVATFMLSESAVFVLELLRDRAELLSDGQLAELSHRLAGARGGGALRLDLDMERLAFEDFLQRYYTDDGDGDGCLTVQWRELCSSYGAGTHQTAIADDPVMSALAPPALSAIVAGRLEMGARYERHLNLVEQELQLPLWERGESWSDAVTEALWSNRLRQVRFLPLAVLMPSFSRAGFILELATQRRDAALVAIGLELFRRRTGEYPGSLEELTPRFLPQVPPDRYDGAPLKYRLVDGIPVLYSVGVDRDDDGGRLPKADRPSRAIEYASNWRPPSAIVATSDDPSPLTVHDGDWVLWPPVEDPVERPR